MKYQGLNLSNDAANTPEAVIAENVDFLDLTLHGKKAHLKITGTTMATPPQGAAWYGSLVVAVGGGNLYTVNMATGTVTLKASAVFHASNPVSINTDGIPAIGANPALAIICDGVNSPKVWDGTTLRAMGPPAKPATAPVAVVVTPTPATSTLTNTPTAYTADATALAESFQWTGGESNLTNVSLNGVSVTGAVDATVTANLYESTSAFGSDPTAGTLLATSGMHITLGQTTAALSFTVAQAIKLKTNYYYSLVLNIVNSDQNTTTLHYSSSGTLSGTIANPKPFTKIGGAWASFAGMVALSVTAENTSISGTYSYAYSYKNSARGLESDLSPLASVSPANQYVNIPVLLSGETGVDKIRIYRIGGSHSSYVLVKELANAGATHTDSATDGSLTESATCIGNASPPVGLRAIVSHPAGFLMGFKDPVSNSDGILYCSKLNGIPQEVEIWPGNEYTIGSAANPIMGICLNQTSIIVIRKSGAIKINGTDSTDLSFDELHDVQGTSAPRSVAAGINGGFFLGSESVYTIEYLATPLKLSELRNKILANYQNGGEAGFYWNKQYFIASATAAEVLVLDGRIQGEITPVTLSLTVKCFFTDGQKLYFADNVGDIYQYEGGAARGNWDWQSVVQNLAAPDAKKNAEKVVFDYIGNITVTPYLDGVAQSTISLSSASRKRQEQAFTLFSAYRYQFRFQGTSASAELFGFDIKSPKALVTG